ncbi:major capsid protein [Photobacterium damselae subsp. damselae]|uniref:major capsid protein n=1 Tax=Photobacterium damselae TaxID=38293 RepID=UPI001F1CD8F9|nr:major capsid protein [Photobacterium damselae]UJZ95051.1 major capsid protein [Photobacterium damselae subsp. damselae]UJZ99032.1 major capsid protein [Photobacterium damselae subsp. damselae]
MDLIQLISQLLTPEFIGSLLVKFKKNHTVKYPVRDLIYGKGKQHHFSSIALSDLQKELSNIPVVRRGTEAYALNRGKGGLTKINPNGVEMSDFISASDINDLAVLFQQHGEAAIKSYLENRINDMLVITQKTTEALAAQSLSGTINYPMKTDAGMDLYTVEFGTPLNYDGTKLTKTSTVSDLYMYLNQMHEQMQTKEYGDDVITLAGNEAFALVLGITSTSNQKTILVKMDSQDQINIGGYIIQKMTGKYKGVNGAMTNKVDNKSFCMIDKNANHQLWYLALDDIKAGNSPMPFFASHDIKNNPSGVEIIGRSKPLPAPITNAICWSQALA